MKKGVRPINARKLKTAFAAAVCIGTLTSVAGNILSGRPELMAFPFKEAVTAAGTYEASTVGTNFVLAGVPAKVIKEL